MVLGPCPQTGPMLGWSSAEVAGVLLVGGAFILPQVLTESPSTDQCHSPCAWSSCSVPGCVLGCRWETVAQRS